MKPLALSVQLVGKAFSAGMALLSRIVESQGNYQLNSQEIRSHLFDGKRKGKHSLAFCKSLVFLWSSEEKFSMAVAVPKLSHALAFRFGILVKAHVISLFALSKISKRAQKSPLDITLILASVTESCVLFCICNRYRSSTYI